MVQGSVVKFLSSCLATPDKIRTCHSNLDYTTILSPEKRTESIFLPKTRSLHFSIENDVHSLVPWSGVLGCLRGSAFFARMRTIGTLSQGAVRKAHKRLLSWDQSSPKRWNTLMGGMSWTDIRPLCSSCIVSICLYDTPAASEISWDSRLRMPDCLGIYFFWTWIRTLNDQWHSVQDKLPTPCPWTPWTPSKRATPDRFSVKVIASGCSDSMQNWILAEHLEKMKPVGWKGWLHPGHLTLDLHGLQISSLFFINIMGAISHIAPCPPDVPPGWSGRTVRSYVNMPLHAAMPSSRLSQGYHGPVSWLKPQVAWPNDCFAVVRGPICCRPPTSCDDPLISTVILRVKMLNGVWSSNCYLHASKCTKPQ